MNRKDRRSQGNAPAGSPEQQKAALIQQALDAATELVKYEKLDEASAIYRGILEHAPHNTTAMFNLGIIAHRRSQYDDAEKLFNQILAMKPDDAEAISALGVIKLDQGDIEGALALSEKAVSKNPTAEAYARKGGLLRELGKMDDAIVEIQKAISLNPEYIGAYYDLSISKKFTSDDPDLLKMAKLAKKADKYPLERQTQLHFALGKAYVDAQELEKAFDHYNSGNKLKRETLNYTADFMQAYLQEIADLFTPEFMETHKDIGHSSDKPIFIIGMPRSGTTLVEQIIASHPDVHGAGELHAFRNAVPVVPNPALPELFTQTEASCHKGLLDLLSKDVAHEIAEEYLADINKLSPNQKHVTDKMPFNFLWAGLIRLVFPNAKIVHCTRNPMDTGLSIYRQLFTQLTPWAYDLKEIGQVYNGYKHLTDHWHNLFPNHIYNANYESIVSNQEEETRKLLAFCELEWHDDCLEFYKAKRQVKTASVYQVRQPIYKDSVKGWRRFETQLQPLADVVQWDTTQK